MPDADTLSHNSILVDFPLVKNENNSAEEEQNRVTVALCSGGSSSTLAELREG